MDAESGGVRHNLARLRRQGVPAVAAMVLAVLACYGVLALSVLLPLVGIRLALDASLWGGTIVLFTVLTVLAVLAGIRAHRAWMPAATAIVGGALILHALLWEYRALVEFAGFVLLGAAVIHDVSLHRRPRGVRSSAVTPGSTPG